MRQVFIILITSLLSGCFSASTEAPQLTKANISQTPWIDTCGKWDDWDKAGPPFQIHANSYYVGTCGISSILITGTNGHILIDGGTEQGAALIAQNISSLGFDVLDIKILLHSHEHFDHVAGLAELQRLSGARLYASIAAKPVLESGRSSSSDPQHGMHDPFPPSVVHQTVKDGDIIPLGDLSLTAIATPGHTEGAMSWQWKSCQGAACEWIVYADSLSPISREGYRFSDNIEYLQDFEQGLQRLKEMECTLLLTPHPSASQMRRRLWQERLSDTEACVNYADVIKRRLQKRLAQEAIGN